jgi:MoaA/NifB/PqqE/SkfB family radical SAM enzyme
MVQTRGQAAEPISTPRGTVIVSVQVNDACDLACAYCPDDLHRGAAALTPERFLSVLDAAAQAGCRRLALGGGEPTLWPHLGWAVATARARGFEVALTTNARDPVGVAALPLDHLAVSAPKGAWEAFAARPGTTVNVVHLGGQLANTLALLRRAVEAGCRRVVVLPYKGPRVAWRATAHELALLFWLAGQLRRRGVQIALDSYAYRRVGLSAGCGQGFARIGVDGVVRPCSFAGCEYWADRLAAFEREQAADRAAPPLRETVLVENSEVGYYVPLSDSLEVSLSRLAWEDVLGALVEFRRIAAALGPEEARVAARFTPQMDDSGGAPPPPMFGTLDPDAQEETIQRILDAATTFPLSGRRVAGSVLLREVGSADTGPGDDGDPSTRQGYVADLAEALLLWSPPELQVPESVGTAGLALGRTPSSMAPPRGGTHRSRQDGRDVGTLVLVHLRPFRLPDPRTPARRLATPRAPGPAGAGRVHGELRRLHSPLCAPGCARWSRCWSSPSASTPSTPFWRTS